MSRWNLGWLVGVTAAALFGISLTYSAPAQTTKKQRDLKLVSDVLDEVQNRYVKPLDQDQMRELVENMLNGGLEKLDPHSGFMGKEEYKLFDQQTKGKFGGVGIRLGLDSRTGKFVVESPIAGSPAYEAGVMAGDVILKVNGKSIANWSLSKVVDNIQGDKDTEVTLTVRHEHAKAPVDLKMTRAVIKIESVMGDTHEKVDLKKWNFWVDPESKIAYVRINQFTETTAEELTSVVDALQKSGMKGLVVDLRDNPGGLLKAAVEVASQFLPEGQDIVSTKGRGGVVKEVFRAKLKAGMKAGTGYPMVILLNRYSASASEIVSSALQDHARAVIIGERSYGKGSVQNLIPTEGGQTALRLTTASYWRPSGRNIHRFPDSKETDDWGVKPNEGFAVKLTDEERIDYYKWRRERDILRHPGEKAHPHGDGKKAKEEFHDRVLEKAVDYLHAEIAKQDQHGAQAPAPRPNRAARLTPAAISTSKIAAAADRSYRNVVR